MSTIKPKQPASLVKRTGTVILNILGLMVGIAAALNLWLGQPKVDTETPVKSATEQVQSILDESELTNEQLLDSCACYGMQS